MRLVVKATLNIAERLYLKKNKNRRKSFALKFRYRKISTRLLQRPIDFGFFKTTMDPTVHLTRRKIDSRSCRSVWEPDTRRANTSPMLDPNQVWPTSPPRVSQTILSFSSRSSTRLPLLLNRFPSKLTKYYLYVQEIQKRIQKNATSTRKR